ncbi:MAG: hypothetical protein KJ884_00445 [Gammaproteobacteria bacterium]|nr:hypothetical protein [Gammaproteobacteria bacterium]MBU1490497.1 hypothetical protein [Gammaproteobacteria bacterium]MBU2065620.1 hypothetical protein [Gammaproteobacteria bacterium]MBU2140227.1 hypothetical protein [Gammaproteobacteria bacterium]MBU2215216.1 hypothetical protein [Gammaproteobacteria bacterium]
MPRALYLTRQCLGLVTRIECLVAPLASGNGLWTLVCAAGMAGAQPSALQAQGPFHGSGEAEEVLQAIAESLAQQGYEPSDEIPIWRLHIQSELRRLNGTRSRACGADQLWPER